MLPGQGDGTFACLLDVTVSPGPYWLVPGDFDGNGRLDIATAQPDLPEHDANHGPLT